MKACTHKRGEYSDTYQHCLDCGREVVLIGGVWFEVEAWIQVSTALLQGER
jgi:hypothetical protein